MSRVFPLFSMNAERQYHTLRDFEKGEIYALIPYLSQHEIGQRLSISQQKISSCIRRSTAHQLFENLPEPGRPRKTSAADNHYIVRTAERETRIALAELHQDINIDISEQTIRRRLKEAGIKKRKAFV